MVIAKDDYIEGYEHYGHTTRKTAGWVDEVNTDGEHIYYKIQADDNWRGARGTTLTTELGKVTKHENKPRIKGGVEI